MDTIFQADQLPANDVFVPQRYLATPSVKPGLLVGSQHDWTGVIDPKERRKRQNRLNQKNRRLRLRRGADTTTHSIVIPTEIHPGERHVQAIERLAQQKYFGSPKADMLLTLVQFNVFRALLSNMCSLGLTSSWLLEFATSAISTGAFNKAAPSALRPTQLQRSIEHHPWIDLFPFPALRDNILREYETCDEDGLCAAMVGWCSSPSTRTGLIVWGEAWDPAAWELTEGFCESFPWVLEGCKELLQSTNYWRAQRDEEPLRLTI